MKLLGGAPVEAERMQDEMAHTSCSTSMLEHRQLHTFLQKRLDGFSPGLS